MLAAGYNSRVVLFGPEQPLDVLVEQLNGIHWHGTGVGYGVRGSRLENVTIRFEEILDLYREVAPGAQVMFDHSPDSALWAVERYFPLAEDCTDSPGTDLVSLLCSACGLNVGS